MRSFATGFVLLAAVLLGGCWDHQELNQLTMVSGIAIDQGEHRRYAVTVEIVNATEMTPKQSSGQLPNMVYMREGDSIPETIRMMGAALPRRLFFSHLQVVLVGEELARSGNLEFFDIFEASQEYRENVPVALVKGMRASDVLQVTSPLEKIETFKLASQLEAGTRAWGLIPQVTAREFISMLNSKGKSPMIGAFAVHGNREAGQSSDNLKRLIPEANVEMAGSGVFRGMKLLGYLSIKDTRNALWVQDRIKQTSIRMPCPEDPRLQSDYSIYRSDVSVDTSIVNGRPSIRIDMFVEAALTQMECRTVQLSDPRTIDQLDLRIAAHIKRLVTDTVRQVQQRYRVDIFGFGEHLEKQHPRYFRGIEGGWESAFPQAETTVNVKSRLRSVGITSESFLLKGGD